MITKHLTTTTGMTAVDARIFREAVERLLKEGRTFTAWEASRAGIEPLIAGHPGLRHEQTRDAVHALLAPYLASGAYHAEPVHIGPGREPLLYYPDDTGLRGWLAAHPGAWLLREGPPELGLISLKEAGQMAGISSQHAGRKAKDHGLLTRIGGHSVIWRAKWCEFHDIDPAKPPAEQCHPKTRPPLDDFDIDECIADYFYSHPGPHRSVKELHAAVREKSFDISRDRVLKILKSGQSRGDYDEDIHGLWFPPQGE